MLRQPDRCIESAENGRLRFQAGKEGACLEIQNSAAEIKLRAERRAGELLEGMELRAGARDGKTESHDETPLLSYLDISKSQSSRWQKIAAIPEPVFEDFIESTKAAEKELTTAGALRLVPLTTKKPTDKCQRAKDDKCQRAESSLTT